MLELNQELAKRLQELDVELDEPDENTLLLQSVPVNTRFYTKQHTNLLIKRPEPGSPFIVSVDADLQYVGADDNLMRAFDGGIEQKGWRTLIVAVTSDAEIESALDHALEILGFDGSVPSMPLPGELMRRRNDKHLLERYATDLSKMAAEEKTEYTVGRTDEVVDVVSGLMRWGDARTPIICGDSGVGKTNLLHAVADKLREVRPETRLLAIDLNKLLMGTSFEAEYENLCGSLMDELRESPDTVVALEHFELVFIGRVPRLLVNSLNEDGVRFLGTMLPDYEEKVQAPLERRLHFVYLEEPTPMEAAAMVGASREAIAEHHNVEIPPRMVDECVKAAEPLAGAYPAKALDLLDGAASRASLTGAGELSLEEIFYVANHWREPVEEMPDFD